ncbi:MAG TPA: hypothetical protein VGM25_02620 [Caulobacteraceae bacterium]|jgi:hypothetical protein
MGGLILLASCGRPDSSGVYVAKSGREASLIQLAQTKDGAVSGRIEVMSIGPGGTVNDEAASFGGAATDHDLTLAPGSAGLAAAGSFSRDTLTISRKGIPVSARKASLADFRKAVAQLTARAAEERRRVAESRPGQDAGGAAPSGVKDAATLERAVTELQADTAKLDAGVSSAPDFGRQSVDNSSKITQMARSAPTLGRPDRDRLIASANQLAVATNQIDIARTRYAIGLDQIVQHASPLATEVQRFCDTPSAAQLQVQCSRAKAAATGFESALVHGSVVLKGYKQTIQEELVRQNEMVQRMGG